MDKAIEKALELDLLDQTVDAIRELSDIQLAVVGGGIADVVGA